MSKAFESIMKGLEEIKAHNEGKTKLRTTTIEIKPPSACDSKAVKELRQELHLSQHEWGSDP